MATDIKSLPKSISIQSTGGAIPYLNEKGEVSMKKVKVQRYISGKRPDYAPSSDESTDYEEANNIQSSQSVAQNLTEYHHQRHDHSDYSDDSVKRHHRHSRENIDVKKKAQIMERLARHKQLHKENESGENISGKRHVVSSHIVPPKELSDDISSISGSDTDESDINEEEIEKRRLALRQKLLEKIKKAKEKEKEKFEQQKLAKEIKSQASKGNENRKGEFKDELAMEEESSSEEDEEEDDDDFDIFNRHQRLKPVFVPKKDRITIKEREDDDEKQRLLEIKAKKAADERRKETLRLVEEDLKRENEKSALFANKINPSDASTPGVVSNVMGKGVDNHATISAKLEDIDTEDEYDDNENFDSWKMREIIRLKREKDDKEKIVKEKVEIEKWHKMTEDERVEFFRQNPKIVTNKAMKGKYRFLQKYYHRGAFFLDEEEDVFKRDVTLPTLEDHFDKTIMPKIMQVKNFGKAGRTKYTHLVDQDTTAFDSPWSTHNPQSVKFINDHAGGMKQVFNRPSRKK